MAVFDLMVRPENSAMKASGRIEDNIPKDAKSRAQRKETKKDYPIQKKSIF